MVIWWLSLSHNVLHPLWWPSCHRAQVWERRYEALVGKGWIWPLFIWVHIWCTWGNFQVWGIQTVLQEESGIGPSVRCIRGFRVPAEPSMKSAIDHLKETFSSHLCIPRMPAHPTTLGRVFIQKIQENNSPHTLLPSFESIWVWTLWLRSFTVVQLSSHVWLFMIPWTAACQASLPFIISWRLLKFMSIASVMPSSHLILWCPLFLLPSIFPSIMDFSNESIIHIRLSKYWSFSFNISPLNEYSGLISLKID